MHGKNESSIQTMEGWISITGRNDGGLFMGYDPTRGSDQEIFNISRVGSGLQILTGRVGVR